MKKILKIITGIIIALLLVGVIFLWSNNETMPTGVEGKEADQLAQKILQSLNFDAYEKTTFLEWNFRGIHHYKWNKKDHIVTVSWDDTVVELHPDSPSDNKVIKSTEKLDVEKVKALYKKATDYFNNDSFWLIAPYKLFEDGVERRLVKENGKDALLITYKSGGSTPGDSYLWILDEKGMPTSFKMWVSIIPTGGVEATWSDWKTTESGAMLPTKHSFKMLDKASICKLRY